MDGTENPFIRNDMECEGVILNSAGRAFSPGRAGTFRGSRRVLDGRREPREGPVPVRDHQKCTSGERLPVVNCGRCGENYLLMVPAVYFT